MINPTGADSPLDEISAEQQHLHRFLVNQHTSDSIVLYGNADAEGASLYVTSILIPKTEADLTRRGRYTSWGGSPFDSPSCGLVYGGGSGPRVEYNEPHSHSSDPSFRGGKRLVFGRTFEGLRDAKSYFELSQELTHAHGLHWVDERDAWCRPDDSGDVVEPAKVDAIELPGGRHAAKTVSLNRDLLNLHMAATGTCLVQMFDFTVTPAEFHGFDGGKEKQFSDPARTLVMKYRLDGNGASYFRGAQIVFPPLSAKKLGEKIYLAEKAPKKFASFVTQDFKNIQYALARPDYSAHQRRSEPAWPATMVELVGSRLFAQISLRTANIALMPSKSPPLLYTDLDPQGFGQPSSA
jgi:hypothetical protein